MKKIRNKIMKTHAMKMIDKSTSWSEMIRIGGKPNCETSRVFDRKQLFQNPLPEEVAHENEAEITQEFQDALQFMGLKANQAQQKIHHLTQWSECVEPLEMQPELRILKELETLNEKLTSFCLSVLGH